MLIFGSIGFFVYYKKKQTNKVFWCGLVAVEYENKWGYINSRGKKKIDFTYEFAYNFTKNKLALVGFDSKFGYINTKGEYVIDPIYDNATSFSGEVAICKLNGKFGTINSKGETVADFIYSDIKEYSDDYAIAVKDGKYGIIDKKGNIIIDFSYEKIDSVNETYFKYYKDGSIYLGFIDKSQISDTFFTDSFQEITLLKNGYAIYKRKGLYGYLNNKKEIVVENKFTSLTYQKGKYLSYSTTGDLYGLLDFDGNIFIRERFLYVSCFDNYAVVKYSGDEKYYIINDKVKHTYSIKCNFVDAFYKNRAVFKQGDYYGVISPKGKVMLEAEYKYISHIYDDGYAIIMDKNSNYGIARVDGSIIVEPKYSNIAYSGK